MDDPILRIRQQNEEKARLELEQARHDQEIASLASIDTTVVEVMKNLVEFLDGKVTKTEVINQLDTIKTPDVYKVVEAIAELGIITESNRIDLSPLKEALLSLGEKLDQLPKSFPEIPKDVSVSNLSDIEIPEQKEIDFSSVIKAINNIKMVAEAPQVTVNTDLDPLKKEITNVVKSIKAIKFPEIPKTDLSKVEKKLDVSNRILKDIYEKPVGGGGSGSSWPAVNSEGLAQPLTIDDNGALQITGSITASASTLADYSVNDMTDTYFGFTKPDGTWLLKKVLDTSVGYATVSNNGTVTSYTDAWTNKATLTYERFDEAF
jgi:hypothetical protein